MTLSEAIKVFERLVNYDYPFSCGPDEAEAIDYLKELDERLNNTVTREDNDNGS